MRTRKMHAVILLLAVLLVVQGCSACARRPVPSTTTAPSVSTTAATSTPAQTTAPATFTLKGYTYEGVKDEAELAYAIKLEPRSNGQWAALLNGKEVPYTGIVKNDAGFWYVENGIIDFQQNGFFRDYQGTEWVYKGNKAEKESETTTTTTTPASRTLVEPDDSQIYYHPAEVWSSELGSDGEINMRYGPSQTEYEVIRTIRNGTEVTAVTGIINGWTMVEIDGQRGWVRSDLVMHVGGGIAKPVLYLYPEKAMDVTVQLELKNTRFSCTYPDYGSGWHVKARPDGTLTNYADRKEYSYLYWELDGALQYDFSSGFVVPGKDTANFLQKTLARMGLTPREYNEFIVYWLPRMQNNKYNLISFQTATYTDNVKLNISPKPDSVLRVAMSYKPLDKFMVVPAQSFAPFERKGFTVVEWGGEEVR